MERAPIALALFDPHRSAGCSETSLQFMLWCQPCSPAPSTGFGQPGGKQPGGGAEALDWGGGSSEGREEGVTEPGLSSGPFSPSPRDSLRVFSSLCQIFSEEDNYSQSRELLVQVRAWFVAFPPLPAPYCSPTSLYFVTTRR